jgi:hypothetical protein
MDEAELKALIAAEVKVQLTAKLASTLEALQQIGKRLREQAASVNRTHLDNQMALSSIALIARQLGIIIEEERQH